MLLTGAKARGSRNLTVISRFARFFWNTGLSKPGNTGVNSIYLLSFNSTFMKAITINQN